MIMGRLEGNPRLKELILGVVEKQIRENEPPETGETFARLCREGYAAAEARQLIGSVVAIEIFGVLKRKEGFDLARFVRALNRLPELPIGAEPEPPINHR